MNRNLKGGLFDGRGKPRPLEVRAKAKRPPVTPEKTIQSSFIEWRDTFKQRHRELHAIFAVPNGIWTHKAVAKAMVAQGMTAGIPDIICLAPSSCGRYHGLVIEFKSEQGDVTPEQKFFIQFFSDLGMRTAIMRDWTDAARLVNEHLGTSVPVPPKRGS